MSKYLVGLGSSHPMAMDYIQRAILQMYVSKFINVKATASMYPNPPAFGMTQYGFVNSAVAIETSLPTDGLWFVLHAIEYKLGRLRILKNGPRTIDLDILWCANYHLSTPYVILPHPGLFERSFALNPAKEAAKKAGWAFKARH